MAFYNYLKYDFKSISDRKFVAKRIIKLKKHLSLLGPQIGKLQSGLMEYL